MNLLYFLLIQSPHEHLINTQTLNKYNCTVFDMMHAEGNKCKVMFLVKMNEFLLTQSSHLMHIINTIALSLIRSCECMQDGNKVMFPAKMDLLFHSSHLMLAQTLIIINH